MCCTRRTLLVIIALNVASIGRTDEPTAESKPQADSKSSTPSSVWAALEWKKATPSPFARVESPAAVVKGKIYMFGGFTDDLQASNRVDVYDPTKDSWARLKDMPTGVTHLNPAQDGSTIWFAGGFKGRHPGPVTAEVWKYDSKSDTWSKGPQLPERRAGGGLAIVGRKLHYFGGYKVDRNTDSGDHWSLPLDGGTDWKREANLPDPRGHVSSAVLDGKIYALGGDHGHDITQIDVDSCHRFDPMTNKWSAIASLPDGRSHFESSTIVYKGRILVVGGRCNSSKPPRTFGGTFPRLAQLADRLAIVRSFGTYNGGHDLTQLTRRWKLFPNLAAGQPSWGSAYTRVAGSVTSQGVPKFALINSICFEPGLNKARAAEFTRTFVASSGSGTLGPACSPFYLAGGSELLENMKLRLPADRFADRRELVRQLDSLRRRIDSNRELDNLDTFQQRAFDVITRGAVEAFNVDAESPATQALYDTSEYELRPFHRDRGQLDNYTPRHLGRQMLMARRLCEAGCGFVQVDSFGWDMHGEKIGDQFGVAEGFNALGWAVDKAVAGFISDCESRGLGKKIMLIVTGEMGRTPRINNRGGGRDHWGEITPLLVYGGGLRMGQVVGASDRNGGKPTATAYNTDDLAATIMHVLFDGGQLRLRPEIPAGITRYASSVDPILPLMS